MNTENRTNLESAGWRVATVDEFLGLTPEESAYIELKLALSQELRKRREQIGLTQEALAERIESSQSRVAKAEASDPGITIDWLVQALLATGWSAWPVAGGEPSRTDGTS